MDRISVESSCVAAIGYDPSQSLLEVEFTSGEVYQYPDVPEDVYQAFISADSIGAYFRQHISQYSFVRI